MAVVRSSWYDEADFILNTQSRVPPPTPKELSINSHLLLCNCIFSCLFWHLCSILDVLTDHLIKKTLRPPGFSQTNSTDKKASTLWDNANTFQLQLRAEVIPASWELKVHERVCSETASYTSKQLWPDGPCPWFVRLSSRSKAQSSIIRITSGSNQKNINSILCDTQKSQPADTSDESTRGREI